MSDVRDNAEQHRFEIVVDGEVAGFAEYQRRDGAVVMTHTEVGDAYEGQGLAGKLVQAALDQLRASGDKVVAECPYVAKWIERHPDYQDLLAA
jgi:uncharacterized protein